MSSRHSSLQSFGSGGGSSSRRSQQFTEGDGGPSGLALVENGTIRVPELLMILSDEDGAIEAFELDDLEMIDDPRASETGVAEMRRVEDVADLAALIDDGSWVARDAVGGGSADRFRPRRDVLVHS